MSLHRVVICIVLVALAGCGGQPTVGTLTGAVTLDGQPVETGAITLTPVDGAAAPAGDEIKNGQYRVEAPLGKMKVSLSSPKVVGKKKLYNTPESPEMPIMGESIPERYNKQTELTVEIVPGSTQKDFNLTTAK